MDAAAEVGRNPVSKHQIQPEYGDEQADAGRDCQSKPVSRNQILMRERRQGNVHFPCSADQEQDWQPYPADPYSCYVCDHTLSSGCTMQCSLSAVGVTRIDYIPAGYVIQKKRLSSLCLLKNIRLLIGLLP